MSTSVDAEEIDPDLLVSVDMKTALLKDPNVELSKAGIRWG